MSLEVYDANMTKEHFNLQNTHYQLSEFNTNINKVLF